MGRFGRTLPISSVRGQEACGAAATAAMFVSQSKRRPAGCRRENIRTHRFMPRPYQICSKSLDVSPRRRTNYHPAAQ